MQYLFFPVEAKSCLFIFLKIYILLGVSILENLFNVYYKNSMKVTERKKLVSYRCSFHFLLPLLPLTNVRFWLGGF